MRVIRSLPGLSRLPRRRRVLTIGAFDGLHLGHQAIFLKARAIAERENAALTTLTFEPTPAEFFARGEPPARLTRFRERLELLDGIGVDELVCPNFRSVNALDHERFVEQVLVDALGVGQIVVGDDFRYGAGRRGDVASLETAGRAFGFDVLTVDPVFLDGERVSSTRIRCALGAGDLVLARRLLGRDYSMAGRVVHGLGLGKSLGFPTANVNLKRRRAPIDGIFAVQVDGLARRPLDGVASVGNRPTVGGRETLLEVYIFDFEADVYGEYITVRFRHRLRAEEKFASIDALKVQMHADAEAAKAALAERIA